MNFNFFDFFLDDLLRYELKFITFVLNKSS